MTFPLGSLGAEAGAASGATYTRKSSSRSAASVAAPQPEAAPRWRTQAALVFGALAWLLFVLAMLSHDVHDASFSTSGDGSPLHNKAGLLGAWLSDLGLFLFGYSVWWLVLAAGRTWLSALARLLRHEPVPPSTPRERLAFWGGLALLMIASTALEWTRLYRLEGLLPGHAGGVLGFTLGPFSMRWLGFAGSGVTWIAVLVLGMSLALLR